MRVSLLRLSQLRVAVLHQGAPVPAVGGVIKPFKPGGYQDSSADLAYNLRAAGEDVVTPVAKPDPTVDAEWSFPDAEDKVRTAVRDHGATVLWANTTLHSQHSLVKLRKELVEQGVRMIGQSPLDTERFEDKEWINRWLAQQTGLKDAFPRSALVHESDLDCLGDFGTPAVAKPVRGRGSHGVTLVKDKDEIASAVKRLLTESDAVLCEEYLSGEEVTITVMPPGDYQGIGKKPKHWSLPVVTRFGHADGIAPYNGIVAVTANSRVLTEAEHANDPEYRIAQEKCALVAELCRATAPIRIDCRRKGEGGKIFLFDVNMKPNATGPGRPGRDQQASLTTMAASAIGWDYQDLIRNIVRQAQLVEDVIRT